MATGGIGVPVVVADGLGYTGGLEAVVVVVVVVIFVIGYVNLDISALVGMRHPNVQFSSLTVLLLRVFRVYLASFGGGGFLTKLDQDSD